ncbi:alpha/beta fold hydrolase [Actinoplanes sp. CA-131856]
MKIARRLLGAVIVLLVAAVAAVYLWPLHSSRLTHGTAATLPFGEARARAESAVSADTADSSVTPRCRTKALLHPGHTAKAVLMLHGYTDCPAQFDSLAKLYYDKGYNVYVPRAPRHGVTDTKAHAGLHADELADYAEDALTVTSGLGGDVGVVGVSGGAVLATWLAEYRPDAVAHLLALSPFYQPAAEQAPAWQVKPLIVLYGSRLLPDHFNGNGFSYAALSQYLRIVRNYRDDPVNAKLTSVAVVTSANDTFIDRGRAAEITQDIASANKIGLGRYEIPAQWGVGHDTADPAGLGGHAAELEQTYFGLYEGTGSPSE